MGVFKDKNTKKWYYEFRYKTATGEVKRRRKRGFALKNEAKEAESLERLKLKDSPPSQMTLKQLYDMYVVSKSPEWLPGTKKNFTRKVIAHIMPYFENIQIDKITTKDIEDWKTSLYEKRKDDGEKYKPDSLNKIRGYFSAMFNYAISHQFLVFNPVRAVPGFKDPNARENVEKTVWSLEEFQKFITKVDNQMWHVFFTFLWCTGTRIGEAQGVMFKDINFRKKTVTISKSIDTKQKGIPYVINPTKTKKTRIIELPNELIKLLKVYYKKHVNIDGWHEDLFLFGLSKPLPNTTVDKTRKKYIEMAGVKYISSHCFRHSHATYLLSNGIDIKSVSERLGHKDVQETLNTYVHVLPSNRDRILALLEKSMEIDANLTPDKEKTA